jgi:NAD(P)H-dependent FMN reductase
VSNFLIISTSLNPDSKSRLLCQTLHERLERTEKVETVDLRNLNLPLCDGAAAYGHAEVGPMAEKIKAARCVLVGVPVYNYAVSASAKNLVELTGRAWTGKLVGFLCAAGGRSSYMAVMNLGNSLMLDFRCLIIPRFVYAEGSMFEGVTPSEDIVQRIDDLAKAAIDYSGALQSI